MITVLQRDGFIGYPITNEIVCITEERPEPSKKSQYASDVITRALRTSLRRGEHENMHEKRKMPRFVREHTIYFGMHDSGVQYSLSSMRSWLDRFSRADAAAGKPILL